MGFRVAALAGLPRVHAINWNEDEGYGGWSLADVYEWARAHDPDGYRQLTSAGQNLVEEFAARQAHSTTAQLHAWFNEPATLAKLHAPYMAMAAMGDLPHAAGTEWVAGWYHRNLRIYFNLARQLQRGDRALVVYGAGHIPLLSHFTTSGGRLDLRRRSGLVEPAWTAWYTAEGKLRTRHDALGGGPARIGFPGAEDRRGGKTEREASRVLHFHEAAP